MFHTPFEQQGQFDDLPEDAVPLEQIQPAQELPDGSVIYNIGQTEDTAASEKETPNFYANLVERIKEEKLLGLAARLLDDIKQDQESRQDWEKNLNIALKHLGFKIEEFKNAPFVTACAAYDSTLSTALLRFYSTARVELFPAAGPARSEIIGIPTDEVEDQGERVKMFMNWYLTQKDTDYYPDSERLLMYVGLFGCAFRKVYQDPVLNRPVSRLVRPQDFIINHYTTSVETADRTSEVVYLSRKDVLLRQKSGDFIEFELPKISEESDTDKSIIKETINKMDGIEPDTHENKSLFKFYEVHINLDIHDVEPNKKIKKYKDSKIPRPYIVTLCETTRKIVSIKRNWRESDTKYSKIEYYVHYYYLPGFGIYSLGLAHLMGSNAIVLTSVLRQLIDAGTFKNFPGGLRMAGMRIEDNDKAIGPGEWREVETGGRALSECFMPMPYNEPSQVLVGLRQELKQESLTLVSTVETEIPELGTNAPVGTTLAMLEVANKVQTSILRSLHVSLGKELKLLFALFGEYLEEEAYPFSVPGKNTAIMKTDFNNSVNIIPVSDPNVLTSAHRLIRNESLLKLAQSQPDIHDMREAYHRMYAAMNVENIDKLLPPPPQPQSLDPSMENMLVLSGKEVAVQMFQEDESHITVHQNFSQNSLIQGNPQAYAILMLHIQQHKCYKAYKTLYYQQQVQMLEQQIGQQADAMLSQGMHPEMVEQYKQETLRQQVQTIQPPQISDEEKEQLFSMPEVQNMVAQQDAEQIQQEMQQQQEEMQQQQEEAKNSLDPNKVMVMDIEQRREAAHLKDKESKLKAETEAFKAQLKFESEKAKMDTQREIAHEKHEVDMAIEGQKLANDSMNNLGDLSE